MQVQNVTGIHKKLFNLRVKTNVFFHFLPELLQGKISLKRFYYFLRRLLLFLAKMQHNKFVTIAGKTRLDLYVPGFPSPAFYTACKKFKEFEKKLPCTTALISITSACTYNCQHCYQKFDKGRDVDLDILFSTVKKLQDMGIAFFNIEGGEPFLVYERLKKLCSVIDDRAEIWINSTGTNVTQERLVELKELGVTALMFSLHSPEPDIFNRFMGSDAAWDTLRKAVGMCHEAGIAVAFNSCLLRDDFYNGNFERVMEVVRDFKACLIQIIKPKPAGGWLTKENLEFTEEDLNFVKAKVSEYNLNPKYKIYPAISAQIIEEDREVFGCTAGGTDRFYINAKGDLQPCEFLNISFGNIAIDDFLEIYHKMRNCFPWGGDCYLCEKYSSKIHRLYKEYNLTSLPLTKEISKEVYKNWERGNKTPLYEQLERLK